MTRHPQPTRADHQPRRSAELARTRALVTARLRGESERLLLDAAVAAEKERAGDKPRESSASLGRKAAELDDRLRRRLALLDQQASMTTKPPLVVTAALVLPAAMVESELPADAPMHAKETKEVERRGVDLVLARESALGGNRSSRPSPRRGSTSSPALPMGTPTEPR